MLSKHIISGDLYDILKSEDYRSFINGRAETIKKEFANIGVEFQSVNEDELEVEEDNSEDDEE